MEPALPARLILGREPSGPQSHSGGTLCLEPFVSAPARSFPARALTLLLLGMSVVVVTWPQVAVAQQLAPALPDAWDASVRTVPSRQAVSVGGTRRDYRWLGTAVGAAALGIAAGLEAAAACGNSESGPRDCTGVTVAVGTLGVVVGGTIGHFIGRAFKRG